ncbi:hypothetical protein [Pengzhenrongella phosphoraccumulans]|uniref:hypothetical protein n=1 Tax=Pengzhenrongella phosphoraccumulans TaxID=3114394 RepID=UPI003890F1B6
MRLSMSFPEALELALSGVTLPSVVREVSCNDATVKADVDLRAVSSPPFALRALAAVAPTVHVEATFRSFAAGRATFDLGVRAGSVPVHRLLNQLTGLLNSGLRAANLPTGLVVVEQGPRGDPQAVVDLQSAVALRADGVQLTAFAIAAGQIDLTASISSPAVRTAPGRRAS